jgi:hypothetical protein
MHDRPIGPMKKVDTATQEKVERQVDQYDRWPGCGRIVPPVQQNCCGSLPGWRTDGEMVLVPLNARMVKYWAKFILIMTSPWTHCHDGPNRTVTRAWRGVDVRGRGMRGGLIR